MILCNLMFPDQKLQILQLYHEERDLTGGMLHGIFIIRISNQGGFKNLWRGKAELKRDE